MARVEMRSDTTDGNGGRRSEGPGSIAAQITTSAVQLFSKYTGRGPTRGQTVLHGDTVTIVLRGQLNSGERKLVAAGREHEVRMSRRAYQEVMRSELTAIVEGQLQRKVIAFLSDDHLDPDVAVEFFLLEPTQTSAQEAG
jgi:uncharacterized protein YbcI